MYKIRLVSEENYVELAYGGTIDLHDLSMGRLEASALTKAHGCTRLLVDLRKINGSFSTCEIFDFTRSHNEFFSVKTKIAVLSSDDHFSNARFSENVARNRGIFMKAFRDKKEAADWLKTTVFKQSTVAAEGFHCPPAVKIINYSSCVA